MKRHIFILACAALVLVLVTSVSCNITTQDTRPDISNQSFTNYVPWWVTNSVSTNGVKQ